GAAADRRRRGGLRRTGRGGGQRSVRPGGRPDRAARVAVGRRDGDPAARRRGLVRQDAPLWLISSPSPGRWTAASRRWRGRWTTTTPRAAAPGGSSPAMTEPA